MAREDLYWRLVHAAEVEGSQPHKNLLNEAAFELSRLNNKVEELMESRKCVTMTVELSPDKMKEAIQQAFVNVIGKDLEYVAQAVYEKIEREGELVGEAEAEEAEQAETAS